MKIKKKALMALVISVAMMTSLSTASLAVRQDDQFVGYEQTGGDTSQSYAKLYYSPTTNQTYINGYASTVEWRHAYYEAEYPHKEVLTLILDGTNTEKTKYSGAIANAPTMVKADFWETVSPYKVYHRLYSNLNNTGFKPSNYVDDAGKTEKVKVEFVKKGFDKYVIDNNGTVEDFSYMYSQNAEKIEGNSPYGKLEELESLYYDMVTNENGYFTDDFLKGKSENAYKIFENAISTYTWETLTGPDYNTGVDYTITPFDKIVEGSPAEWFDKIIAKESNKAKVKWVLAGNELEAPYRYYEFLEVDGVVMDGREIEITNYKVPVIEEVKRVTIDDSTFVDGNVIKGATEDGKVIFEKTNYENGKTRLPRIFRYAGGINTNVKIDWVLSGVEAAYPHAVYEEKLVNGVKTGETRYTGEYVSSVPVLDYTKNNPRHVKIKLTGDKAKDNMITGYLGENNYNYIVYGYDVIIDFSSTNVYKGHSEFFDDVVLMNVVSNDWNAAIETLNNR